MKKGPICPIRQLNWPKSDNIIFFLRKANFCLFERIRDDQENPILMWGFGNGMHILTPFIKGVKVADFWCTTQISGAYISGKPQEKILLTADLFRCFKLHQLDWRSMMLYHSHTNTFRRQVWLCQNFKIPMSQFKIQIRNNKSQMWYGFY